MRVHLDIDFFYYDDKDFKGDEWSIFEKYWIDLPIIPRVGEHVDMACILTEADLRLLFERHTDNRYFEEIMKVRFVHLKKDEKGYFYRLFLTMGIESMYGEN
jgi:hypothetical protein